MAQDTISPGALETSRHDFVDTIEEDYPQLKTIRHIAFCLKGLKKRGRAALAATRLKDAANEIGVDLEEHFYIDSSGLGRCDILLDNVILGSGGPLVKRNKVVNRAYKSAVSQLLKPQLKLEVDPDSNKVVLRGLTQFVYDLLPHFSSKKQDQESSSETPQTPCSLSLDSQLQQVSNKMSPRCETKESISSEKRLSKENAHPVHDIASRTKHLNCPQTMVLLVKDAYVGDAISILQTSATFNKMKFELKHGEGCDGNKVCHVLIEEKNVASASGGKKQELKSKACSKALEKLKTQCWCIMAKGGHDSYALIKREDVLHDAKRVKKPFTQVNEAVENDVGRKMMEKMGWKGEPLGVNGQGIAEPVTHLVDRPSGRQGLGFVNTKKNSLSESKAFELLHNYACNSSTQDLIYRKDDFTSEERKILYRQCAKLHLKQRCQTRDSISYGVIYHDWTKHSLFDFIQSHGGETEKYILIPPESEPVP